MRTFMEPKGLPEMRLPKSSSPTKKRPLLAAFAAIAIALWSSGCGDFRYRSHLYVPDDSTSRSSGATDDPLLSQFSCPTSDNVTPFDYRDGGGSFRVCPHVSSSTLIHIDGSPIGSDRICVFAANQSGDDQL